MGALIRRQGVAALVMVGLLSLSAQAGPIIGYYESEFTGEVLEGRWSESYVSTGPGQIGNTVHAASWDGTTLATQWELVDAAIDSAPTPLLNTVNANGDGMIVWYTTYSGGVLTLTDLGPWWNSDDSPATSYTVNLTTYSHTTQNTYRNGVLVASSTIVDMAGVFPDYDGYSVEFVVAQAIPAGEGAPLPAGYPEWLPQGEDDGAYGVCQKIRMEIVPEPATMGLLGLGLGAMLFARRRHRR